MGKYRKKPVVVDAVRWDGGNYADIRDFAGGEEFARLADGGLEVYDKLHDSWIKTKQYDYVIKGRQGEIYPCDGEEFVGIYDLVTDAPGLHVAAETPNANAGVITSNLVARNPDKIV